MLDTFGKGLAVISSSASFTRELTSSVSRSTSVSSSSSPSDFPADDRRRMLKLWEKRAMASLAEHFVSGEPECKLRDFCMAKERKRTGGTLLTASSSPVKLGIRS
eukprot:2532060-Rhodomonas_salina.1